MNWSLKLSFTAFLIISSAINGAHGDAMVTGTVFCDQCKDGKISLYDYPLYGIKVKMGCPGSDGQLSVFREEVTNWLGSYAIKFDGAPDLSRCSVQVLGNGQGSGCGAAAGPAGSLRLMFRMFDMEMYNVDPLLSQPAQPMPYCLRSYTPVPVPVTPANPPPVPVVPTNPPPAPPVAPASPPPVPLLPPPQPPMPSPLPKFPPMPKFPPIPKFPPMPKLPPMPPAPFVEASACSHQQWLMPQHRCYWKVVTPDTKITVVFGLIAGRKYGTDMTLMQGMSGRADPYKTLLREGITALLNSYNSLQFPYHPLDVIQEMNLALMGSTQQVLHTALRFMRANSGNGKTTCKLTPCK